MFSLLFSIVFLQVLSAVFAITARYSSGASFNLTMYNKTKYRTHYLLPGKVVQCCETSYNVPPLDIYCYQGHQPYIQYFWQAAFLHMSLLGDEYEVFEGPTATAVIRGFSEGGGLDGVDHSAIRLHPFKVSCVGVRSKRTRYRVVLELQQFDRRSYLRFLLGVGLYLAVSNVSCVGVCKSSGLHSGLWLLLLWSLWVGVKVLGLMLMMNSSHDTDTALNIAVALPVSTILIPVMKSAVTAFWSRNTSSGMSSNESD